MSPRALTAHDARIAKKVSSLRQALKYSERRNTLVGLAANLGPENPSNITSFGPLASNNIYPLLTFEWTMLAYMYKTHGVLQTALEVPVLDALRGGVEITSTQIAKNIPDLQEALEEEDVFGEVAGGLIWGRLFGGGGLIVSNGQPAEKPLDLRKKAHVATQFIPASRWELGSQRFAEFYEYYGQRIHHTRVLTVAGKPAPHPINIQLIGWGLSEVERMVEDFNRYLKTANVLYELLEEAKIDVFKLEGFNELCGTDEGTDTVTRRVMIANKLKNFQRALLLDKEDEYEQKQISSFAGLADVMRENRIGIASAVRMPFSKLFGTTAGGSGLANSGQDDVENYNSMVESEIRAKARGLIRQVIAIKIAERYGIADCQFSLKYRPLRVLSPTDEETVKTSKTNRLKAYFDMGIISRPNAAKFAVRHQLVDEDLADTKGLLDAPDFPGDGEKEEEVA